VAEAIRVEVAYATPARQRILTVEADGALSVRQAIERSGILEQFPEIDLDKQDVGVFSKSVTLDHQLANGDRVEIYRPLIADPKAARKKRAAKGEGTKAPSNED